MKGLRTSYLTGVALTAAGLLSLASGCEIIAGVDRSLIDTDNQGGAAGAGGGASSSSSSSGQAGMGGMGGSGGGMGGMAGAGGMGGSGGGMGMGGMGGAGGMMMPQCTMNSDCPPPQNGCSTVACVSNSCVTTNVMAGTPVGMQTSGDCKVNACDGNGNVTMQNDNADVPMSDGIECTDDICLNGTPYVNSMAGAMCTMGGKVCNGMGLCVECNVGGDCMSGVCLMNACQAATCMDLIKNGTETDVDCGGSCMTKCADTKMCSVDADCTSGMCLNGTCVASINGCNVNTAMNLTANMTNAVAFGGANGQNYVPRCIKVKPGSTVTFNDNFQFHNLTGGVIANNMGTPAASGPFIPATTTGSTKNFTMTNAGTFPYYCIQHIGSNMSGVVFVVP